MTPNPPAEASVVSGSDSMDTTLSVPSVKYNASVPAIAKPTGPDDRDKDTPDEWVHRDPRLIRLTGRHPFNVEPPPKLLHSYGLTGTPAQLHFVRNHAKVPQIKWEEHRLSIEGLVDKPLILSMDDIVKYPQHTFPVTLTCAGNRRKEQNMTKQTVGFNWGPAGTSTSFWTGVMLRDILLEAGVHGVDEPGRYHVCMEGADVLPQGHYGTSFPLAKALNPADDIMLAFKQNGEFLEPDHGYPLRMLIPGWIGGRMVKWITKIIITDKESDNYYHFFDNRILPPQIDKEIADKDGWWYPPEYLFNQLNINSAIVYPGHDDTLAVAPGTKYTMEGYCYTGDGHRVTRVEVSFDGGNVWELTKLKHVDPSKHGKHWCWSFWSLEATNEQVTGTEEIMVRGWDEASNTQPALLTWNVMGMGNNPVYRVKVHPQPGGLVKFEHPTIAGTTVGGWMNRADGTKGRPGFAVKGEEAVVAKVVKEEKKLVSNGKFFTMEEVKKHDTEEDVWIVVRDRVYDCTKYLDEHPGGAESIMLEAGGDATEEFEAIHSTKAWTLLEDYYIGDLDKGAAAAKVEEKVVEDNGIALNPKQRIPFKLIEREELSHDTRRFRFGLQTDKHVLGLPLGKHMLMSANIDGKMVSRAYTPTTTDKEVGYFDLVIKVYFKSPPRFPEGGKLSQHFDSLKIGDTFDVRGPFGEIHYFAPGQIKLKKREMNVSRLSFVCGGTGITPFFQIAKDIIRDPSDKTELNLIYCNKSEEDILLRKEIDEWIAVGRVNVWYVLDAPPADWKFGSGFVNEAMIRDHLPAPAEDHLVLFCGPPIMADRAVVPNLEKVGHDVENNFMRF